MKKNANEGEDEGEEDEENVRIHGKRLMVHELVREILQKLPNIEENARRMIEIQFQEILDNTPELPPMIPMIDVSGSMMCNNGIPL